MYISKKGDSRTVWKDVIGKKKLFWKEVSKVNGERGDYCSRIRDGNGRLALEEVAA